MPHPTGTFPHQWRSQGPLPLRRFPHQRVRSRLLFPVGLLLSGRPKPSSELTTSLGKVGNSGTTNSLFASFVVALSLEDLAHDLLLSLFDLPTHLPSSSSTPAHRQLARLIDEPRRCHNSAITRVQATAATTASAKVTAPELHTTAPAQGKLTPPTSSSEPKTCAKDSPPQHPPT